MLYEIELYFGGEEPYMEIVTVEAQCPTELANLANAEQKKKGAIAVSFGPPIQRNEFGLPA